VTPAMEVLTAVVAWPGMSLGDLGEEFPHRPQLAALVGSLRRLALVYPATPRRLVLADSYTPGSEPGWYGQVSRQVWCASQGRLALTVEEASRLPLLRGRGSNVMRSWGAWARSNGHLATWRGRFYPTPAGERMVEALWVKEAR